VFGEVLITGCMILVLSKFRVALLVKNILLVSGSAKFVDVKDLSKFI
jgi:hypothetical protein